MYTSTCDQKRKWYFEGGENFVVIDEITLFNWVIATKKEETLKSEYIYQETYVFSVQEDPHAKENYFVHF